MSRGNYHKWTSEEETNLVRFVQQHGMQWDKVKSQYFQDMSIVQIRNKYYMLMKYHPAIIEKQRQEMQHKKKSEVNELLDFLEKLIQAK